MAKTIDGVTVPTPSQVADQMAAHHAKAAALAGGSSQEGERADVSGDVDADSDEGADDGGDGEDAESSAADESGLDPKTQARLRKLTSEARNLRKRAKDAEEKARLYDEAEDAKKSELQKAQERADQLELKLAEQELARLVERHSLSDEAAELLATLPVDQRSKAASLMGATKTNASSAADVHQGKPAPDLTASVKNDFAKSLFASN